MDIDPSWGTFDYIICHGVYSWVSDAVQDKIMAVSSCNLTPQGIAYISYNTYPGWHLRQMIRHMMHYHIEQFTDTAKRIVNQRDEPVTLDAFGNELLCALDGSRDHARLREYLMKHMNDGTFILRLDNQPVTDLHLAHEALEKVLTQTLKKLANAALLLA